MYTKDDLNKVVLGDARDILSGFPNSFFDCTITSPPYWKLRKYTGEVVDPREIGQEARVEAYVLHLLEVFDLVYKKTKHTGSLWVNIGESFSGGRPLGVPEWFLHMMHRTRPWILVNKVIWYKVDAMAESTTRRFSQKWEPFYWFVKNMDSYYFNQDAAKIPVTKVTVERMKYDFNPSDKLAVSRMRGIVGNQSEKIDMYLQKGVNCGDLWAMPTAKVKVKHIAPFPEALVARPLVATCPDEGVSLDPFAGSGTVQRATLKLGGGRSTLGIDLNPPAVEEANLLLEQVKQQPGLF